MFAVVDYIGMSLKAVRIKTDVVMPCFRFLRLAVASGSLSSHCGTLLKSNISETDFSHCGSRDGTSRPWQGIWVPRSSSCPSIQAVSKSSLCPLKYISRLYCRSLNHYLTDQLTDSFPQGSGGVIMLLILMGESKMPDEQMCLGVRHCRD